MYPNYKPLADFILLIIGVAIIIYFELKRTKK